MKIDQYYSIVSDNVVTTSNWSNFWHAFASRGFVSDSWAFLFNPRCNSGIVCSLSTSCLYLFHTACIYTRAQIKSLGQAYFDKKGLQRPSLPGKSLHSWTRKMLRLTHWTQQRLSSIASDCKPVYTALGLLQSVLLAICRHKLTLRFPYNDPGGAFNSL